jgi:hypothetical protein
MIQTRSQTRSQTRNYKISQIYEVNIDFNEASKLWKKNKINIGNGFYKYICCQHTKQNNICKYKCLFGENYCKKHF